VGSAVAAHADSATVKVGDDQVYFVLPDRFNLMTVTVMWLKRTTDVDIVIFGDDPPPDGLIVGVGFGTEPLYESVSLGAIQGAATYIVLTRESGAATKGILNIQTMAGEDFTEASGGRSRIRHLGSLDELALTDPRFARLQEQMDRLKRAKRDRLASR
jgi:hypothetical protein